MTPQRVEQGSDVSILDLTPSFPAPCALGPGGFVLPASLPRGTRLRSMLPEGPHSPLSGVRVLNISISGADLISPRPAGPGWSTS